jgi:CheY-like chemotaxis protein
METALKRILVVDDDETIRGIVSKMISRLGYEVLSAANGENGLDLFLKNQFDLVITDLDMPGMKGLDLPGIIKKKSPYTLVILMTGHEKELIQAKIKYSSVDQALFKPFGLVEFEETLQGLLGH